LTNADLYDGRARAALARVESRIVEMRRALLLRIATVRIWTADMHGRSALAVARIETQPAARAALLRQVDASVRAILREGAAWAAPLAHLLRAGAAELRGKRERATDELRQAVYGFEAADMSMHARAAQRWLGALVGGEEGESLRGQTDAWFREQQVKDAEALTAMCAPGYGGADLS
jgi:hypothetical protein